MISVVMEQQCFGSLSSYKSKSVGSLDRQNAVGIIINQWKACRRLRKDQSEVDGRRQRTSSCD